MEARDILKILKDAFHVEITEKEASEFTKIQEKRNRIVHGGNTEINLAEALQFNDFLKDLAQKVDQHLLKTFFILEFITKD
ncbi:HEPN domain-containing protein [Aphanizomenon flos-aquae]|uniref:HEPN domain-containing protein n=1 Tax=Aphanizomenon flos-aquae TaxID=1176 RepID=UPI003B967884